MRRWTRMLGGFAGLTAILMFSGCGEDPKQKIALLEEENHTLYADLESLRGNLDTLTQQRDRCRSDLLLAQQANGDLQGRLAAVPPMADLPGQWQAVPGGAMIALPGSVLFPSGKAVLKRQSKGVLGRIASEIKGSFGGKDIYVFGHTDKDPIKKSKWQDNRQLSGERALAVVRYLQSRGLPPSSVVACGWGEHRPIASNKTSSGKSKNRRVEIYAVDPALVAAR